MTLSTEQRENARKSYSLILQCLQEDVTQTAIAAQLGWTDSKVSRLKNEQMEDICKLLAALNLKIVQESARTVNEEKLKALLLLLADDMSSDALYSKVVEG